MIELFFELNESLFFLMHNQVHSFSWLRGMSYVIAEYMDVVVLGSALMIIIIDFLRRYQKTKSFGEFQILGTIFLTLFFALAVSLGIKNLVAFPRPFITFPEVDTLFLYGGLDSFPSGHALIFSTLAFIMYAYQKKLGIIFGIAAVFIGMSRIMAGIHYPLDVVVGWIIGSLIGYFSYRYFVSVQLKKNQ